MMCENSLCTFVPWRPLPLPPHAPRPHDTAIPSSLPLPPAPLTLPPPKSSSPSPPAPSPPPTATVPPSPSLPPFSFLPLHALHFPPPPSYPLLHGAIKTASPSPLPSPRLPLSLLSLLVLDAILKTPGTRIICYMVRLMYVRLMAVVDGIDDELREPLRCRPRRLRRSSGLFVSWRDGACGDHRQRQLGQRDRQDHRTECHGAGIVQKAPNHH